MIKSIDKKMSMSKKLYDGQEIYADEWIEKKSKTGKIYFYNINTGKKQRAFPTEKIQPGETEKELQDFFMENNMKKHQQQKQRKNMNIIQGLTWFDNSCYMDSVLIAFFAYPNKFTDQILNMDLSSDENCIMPTNNDTQTFPCGDSYETDYTIRVKIQKELKNIVSYIRNTEHDDKNIDKSARILRKLFINCKSNENYHDSNIKDSGEFLSYLLSFFNTVSLPKAQKEFSNYVTHTLGIIKNCQDLIQSSSYIDYTAHIIRFIHFDILNLYTNPRKISNFFIILDDTYPEVLTDFKSNGINYERRINIDILKSAPYIIFNLERYKGYTISDAKIIPEDVIQIPKTNEQFLLVGIVLYDFRHYTCLFYHDGEWYYYDHIAKYNKIRKVGTYADSFNYR